MIAACARQERDASRVRSETLVANAPLPSPIARERFVLVLLGDSLTQGYGLPATEALPTRLQRRLDELGGSIEVRNAGVSGDTSAQGLARFDLAIPRDADGVILQFGANDMLQGRSPDMVRADLATLIDRAKRRGLWVGLVGMRAPPVAGEAYRAAFDRIYPDLAGAEAVELYSFYFEGLIDLRTGRVAPELFLRDGVHPSAAGIDIVAQGMAAWLHRALPPVAFDASR